MSDFEVMAGNDLRTGRVVYLAPSGHWSEDFQQALHLKDESAADNAGKRAKSAVESNLVVDPYLVKITSTTTKPSHIRERIRRSGPTCLPSSPVQGTQLVAG